MEWLTFFLGLAMGWAFGTVCRLLAASREWRTWAVNVLNRLDDGKAYYVTLSVGRGDDGGEGGDLEAEPEEGESWRLN